MAAVRKGRTTVELICPVCSNPFLKEKCEAKRNDRLGRANLCSRSCQATYMNKSEVKLEQTREMLAERNADQYRENNPHWKGGVSGPKKLKPLPISQ